jgi:hypothetical protein
MTFRLRERRSNLATWSARLAVVSIPVLIIAAVGHRADQLDATVTYGVMAVGFTLAALAVIAAAAAFEAIWRDGRKGVRTALWGLFLGLVVLSLPAVGAWKVIAYPRLTDISTDLDDPPAFDSSDIADRGAGAAPIGNPTDEEAEIQRSAYPDIVSRHYSVGPQRVFDDAIAIVTDRGWRVLAAQRPDENDENGSIEAVAHTMIFGFSQDVAIRIQPDEEGALVDMRSAARNGAHDLGANADRIRAFFRDLDASLQGIGADQGNSG